MRPYYDRDGITIYNARCEDVLPSIDPATVGLLLTDPPYGINLDTARPSHRRKIEHAGIEGDNKPFDPTPLLVYGRCVLWGANNFAAGLPDGTNWLVWDKVLQNGLDVRISEMELAWTNFETKGRVFRHLWSGAYRASERKSFVHPSQKPAALMRWIVERSTEPGDLVLDPYMGSGPIAQACHELGRRYIGVELVEEYCAVAVSRLSQQTLDLTGGAA